MPDPVYALIQRVRSVCAESEERILLAQRLRIQSKVLVASARQIIAIATQTVATANHVGASKRSDKIIWTA